ncbi:MAG: CrcB family protein [Rickettsiales bacterium]|nr:CrcB family protein [Rickettsiales bacterium]
MLHVILVALGGAFGSVCRYLSYSYVNLLTKDSGNASLARVVNLFPGAFPFATFFVNVFGSIVAGFIYYFVIRNFENFDASVKHFLFFGFLGGFTTFSTFSLDFFRIINAGQWSLAIAYVLLTVVLAILGVFLGFYLAKVAF